MSSTSPTGTSIDPVIGALRVAGDQRLRDATPCAVALSSPSQAVRSRQGERLFILSDLTGPAPSRFYRELREVVAQTYWSTVGSITAALRQAAAAANRHLFQANLHSTPPDRCHGGLICAILRGKDLFVLQAGSARACFLHEQELRCFSYDGYLAPLGMAQVADVRLYHTYVAPGDELLMASSALMEEMDYTGLARVMALVGMEAVLEGLEQVGVGIDFSAMVVRWPLPEEETATRSSPPSYIIPDLTPSESARVESPQVTVPAEPREPISQRWGQESLVEREPPLPEPAIGPVEPVEFSGASSEPPPFDSVEPLRQEVALSGIPRPEQPGLDEEIPVIRELARPEPDREPRPSLGEWIEGVARSAGRGVAAAGGALIGGTSTLVKRMLPGKEARRRARSSRSRVARPVPKENRTTMITVAIGIPIVLAITVALAYQIFGEDARFNTLIRQAEGNVSLAQSAGITSDVARSYWNAGLEYANAAIALRSDDQVATSLRAQAQVALDQLDGIVRLQPILLKNFGPGTIRRLVVHGQMVFVLDPVGGWVAQLTLNEAGNGLSEQGEIPGLVRNEQQIEGGTVGSLVDFVWVEPAGGRQTGGLVILEEDGALISHDPAWLGEGGLPQLRRSFLGAPPELPRVVGTYDGRFYVLDTSDNQIRRYEPVGDIYPNRPDNYFAAPPPKPMADALDMAIDGYIYVLYADGAILKFLRGEPEPFDMRELPNDLSQAVALAVDPDGSSGVVYVADRGNRRVVALAPEGDFLAQFRADAAFDALEALAVDEAMGRLYVISDGQLYMAPLP